MKYLIKADIKVNGTVQRKDIIGAIMGQTEGLLGDELELRKLQRTARVGHVDVEMESKGGKVHGMILIPSSMDNVETAIIGSALETIDRIGHVKRKLLLSKFQMFVRQANCCCRPLKNCFSPSSTLERSQNSRRRSSLRTYRRYCNQLPWTHMWSKRAKFGLPYHR